MEHMTTPKLMARQYLDHYSAEQNLARPLTPEQVKEAGVIFLDLLAEREMHYLIEQERGTFDVDRAPQTISDVIDDLIDRCTPLPGTEKTIARSHIEMLRSLVAQLDEQQPVDQAIPQASQDAQEPTEEEGCLDDVCRMKALVTEFVDTYF
jgi:hypothetical protein